MDEVICFDSKGKPHSVMVKDLVKRTSCYGIYITNNSVVLTRNEGYQNWDLPGGGVEDGETKEQTLIREFEEETGLVIDSQPKFLKSIPEYYFTDEGDALDSDLNYYLIDKASGELLEDVHFLDTAEAKLVPIADLDKYNLKPTRRKLIEDSLN